MKAKMIGLKKAGMMMATLALTAGLFIGAKTTAFAASEAENNNTVANATVVNLNEDATGVISERGDVDFYKFTVTKPGYVSIDFTHDYDDSFYSSVGWDISLSDANNQSFCSMFVNMKTQGINSSLTYGVGAGTYYIKVSGDATIGANYTVKLNYTESDAWEVESNDDGSTANQISVNKTYNGCIYAYRDVDYYKFTVSKPGFVTLDFDHDDTDSYYYWNVKLKSEDDTLLYSKDVRMDTAGKTTSQKYDLAPGTYYVRVEGSYTNAVKYAIQVNFDSPTSQLSAFVTRMYEVVLGRIPDAAGLNDWVGKLSRGEANAVDIVFGFVNSDEYKNKGKSNGEIVNDCYHAMLGRDADEGGYNDWVGRLDNGMSVNAILAGFVGSEEFGNLCKTYGIQPGSYACAEARDQNLGVTSYVARLYTQALGRNFDPNGLNDWCGRIIADPSRDNIIQVAANGFFHSQEFLNKNLNNEEYVKVLYRTFLGRECDPNGLADWVGQLDRGEKSRDEILPGFANSQEFSNIMAQYGL